VLFVVAVVAMRATEPVGSGFTRELHRLTYALLVIDLTLLGLLVFLYLMPSFFRGCRPGRTFPPPARV
jgi:hypothetical protein